MGKWITVCLRPLIVSLSLYCAAVNAQTVRITSGWCVPETIKASGIDASKDASIRCPGVSPAAHRKLDDELTRLKKQSRLSINEQIKQANLWSGHYLYIQWDLGTLHDTTAQDDARELQTIKQLILDGYITQAAKRLDARISQKDSLPAVQAEIHFLRAGIFKLEFNNRQAEKYFTLAHTLQPDNIKYLLPYAATLIDARLYTQAEKLLLNVLPILRKTASDGSPRATTRLLLALEKLRTIYTRLARNDRIDIVSDEMLTALGNIKTDAQGIAGITAFRSGHNHFADNLLEAATKLLIQAYRLNIPLCAGDNPEPCLTAAKAAGLAGIIEAGHDEHATAIRLFEQALNAYRPVTRQTPADKIRITAIRHEIAEARLGLDQIEKAIETWRQIADDWRENEITDHEYLFMVMHAFNKLGEAAAAKPDYPQAEIYFRRALALADKNAHEELEVEISLALMNLGHLSLAKADAATAKQYAEQATQTFHRYWLSETQTYQSYYLRSLFVLGLSNLSLDDKHVGCQQLLHIQKTGEGSSWDELSREAYNRKCIPPGETAAR